MRGLTIKKENVDCAVHWLCGRRKIITNSLGILDNALRKHVDHMANLHGGLQKVNGLEVNKWLSRFADVLNQGDSVLHDFRHTAAGGNQFQRRLVYHENPPTIFVLRARSNQVNHLHRSEEHCMRAKKLREEPIYNDGE